MSSATLNPPAPTTNTLPKTKFSYTRCPGVPTISALAAPLGLLDAEFGNEPDLDVTLKQIGFTGKVEYPHEDRLWIRNAGHAPAVWARSHGADNRIVALAWLEGYYPVVAARASGINTVAQLKGKRLGLLKTKDTPFDLLRAQQLKIYDAALSSAGLTLADVTLVDLERPKMDPNVPKNASKSFIVELDEFLAHSLKQGEIDVALPWLVDTVAALVDLTIIYDTRNHPDPLARVNPSVLRGIAVSGAILRERRDLVVRALARALQAGDWAKAHPEETGFKLAENYGIPPEQLIPKYVNLSEGIQIDLAPEKIAALKTQKNFLLKHGFLGQDFDVESWVDAGPLEEARGLYAEWKKTGKID